VRITLGDAYSIGNFRYETIALIRERGIPSIMGNYDDGVGFSRDECGCSCKEPEEAARCSPEVG